MVRDYYTDGGDQRCRECGTQLTGSGRTTLCASCQEDADPHKNDFREDILQKESPRDRGHTPGKRGRAPRGAFPCEECGEYTLHDYGGWISCKRASFDPVIKRDLWYCRECDSKVVADMNRLDQGMFRGRNVLQPPWTAPVGELVPPTGEGFPPSHAELDDDPEAPTP